MLLLCVLWLSVCVLYGVSDDSLVCCACFSAYDVLAAVYAAELACADVGDRSPDGVASPVQVPDREHNTLG